MKLNYFNGEQCREAVMKSFYRRCGRERDAGCRNSDQRERARYWKRRLEEDATPLDNDAQTPIILMAASLFVSETNNVQY